MGLMMAARTDNSIITRTLHAYQSWVRMVPPRDNTSVITRPHACAFLRDTSIIVKTGCPPYNAPRYNADSSITRSTVAPEI